jgi:guanylate kinase
LSNQVKRGRIIAVSAPSGTGKTTIVKRVLESVPELIFSVSATTRRKRENETDGVEYFFISEEEFRRRIDKEEFVEWEKFYDYYYGTYKSFLEQNIEKGHNVLLEVDVKGAISLKNQYKDAILIFIVPPSEEELQRRLKNRQTESEEDLRKRVERAKMELSYRDKFDYFIENNELEKAVEETRNLIKRIIKE